jgi:flagellar biosynthesis protein FlhB
MIAPTVIAKGVDSMALKKEVARKIILRLLKTGLLRRSSIIGLYSDVIPEDLLGLFRIYMLELYKDR